MGRNTIRLTESDLHRIVKESVNRILNEDLEDEILIWKKRENDEFGKILKKIEEKVIELFGVTKDEFGIECSPVSYVITAYSLDGNKKYTAKRIYQMLENYDMIGNGDIELDNLVKNMMKLSNK